MTFRFVIQDILSSLKQIGDDRDIQPSHVVYWVQVVANRLRKLHFNKHDTGAFVTSFSTVTIQTDTTLKDRKFIDLPATIYDLDNEKAVKYITYNFKTGECCSGPNFSQVFFQPTTHAKSHILHKSKFSIPTPKRPYFYRSLERLYFLGLECVDVSDVEVGLFTSLDPTKVCDLDEEVQLPDDLVQVLTFEVLNLGNFMKLQPKERINEAADFSTIVQATTQPIISQAARAEEAEAET